MKKITSVKHVRRGHGMCTMVRFMDAGVENKAEIYHFVGDYQADCSCITEIADNWWFSRFAPPKNYRPSDMFFGNDFDDLCEFVRNISNGENIRINLNPTRPW